jgi:hypothetical protein
MNTHLGEGCGITAAQHLPDVHGAGVVGLEHDAVSSGHLMSVE